MNEFIEQFLIEARELIELGTDDLLALEKDADSREKIDGLFRVFHTLKGAAGIVEFASMARALHVAEGVLTEVRNSSRPMSPVLVNNCLACLDQVTRWLDQMQASGELPINADDEAHAIVSAFEGQADDKPNPQPDNLAWLKNLHHLPTSGTAIRYRPDAEAFFRGEDPLSRFTQITEIVTVDLRLPAEFTLENIDPFSCAIEIVAITKAPIVQVRPHFEGAIGELAVVELGGDLGGLSAEARGILQAQVLLLQEAETEGRTGRIASAGKVAANVFRHAGLNGEASSLAALLGQCLDDRDPSPLVSSIKSRLTASIVTGGDAGHTAVMPVAAARIMRVDSGRIDALVNLTGELTVVKNAFGHFAALAQNGGDPKDLAAGLREQQGRFDRLVGELQRAVLRIRVLPLKQVFRRFPRLVREISASIGKSVRFVTEGESTEADAAIVESLFEPLLHIIRNAIDHGSEETERRKELGKPSTSTITLRARRHLENVIVEVEDDGRGIDVERVRDVAANRKLLPPEALAKMNDVDVANLIFAPGFSTASDVTGLSGRGVGMDSVKAAVERVGGIVEIDSRPGQGTTVRLTLPFTVMMTRVMTVETGGQVFGFPLDTVVETAIVKREELSAIGLGRAFVLRDRTVPLIGLAESLGLARPDRAVGDVKVVVTSSAGQLGGIEVEKLGERLDIMLKPMDGLLKNMRGVAGTTLLGDGRVLIVLDVQELFL
jgi:two-component system chemotaxis sensor kinase CheA